MNFKTKAIFAIAVAAFSINHVSAFELKLPKVGSSSSSGSGSVDVNALTSQQAALLKNLSESLRNLTQSQALMAASLGLKAQASIAETNANKLKSGDLTGKDDADKVVTSTLEVNKAIQEELKKGIKLSDESKAQFVSALPYYAKGAVGVVVTGNQAADAAKSLTTTTDLTVLSKLGTLIYIAKQAPSLLSTFVSTTGQVVSFSKANGIDTSSLESATKKWE